MFKIHIMDGKTSLPSDGIFYIIAKNGVFLHKKLDLIESTIKVDSISILEEITPYAKLNIPKIPGKIFGQVVSFFRMVYKLHKSESMVILFYNKSRDKYMIFVPEQEVSRSAVESITRVSFDGYSKVCSIHSHSDFLHFILQLTQVMKNILMGYI